MSEIQAEMRRSIREVRLPAIPRWLGWALPIVICALTAAYPLYDSTSFGLGRIELVLFYMMGAIALNLVHGYGGVLMVGQPALMTVAGYTAGVLSVRYQWDFWLTVPAAILAAVVLSVFMCSPSLRVHGWYLAVLSFMGVAIVPDVVNAFYETTGGSDGLPGIMPIKFGDTEPPRWVIYEVVLVTAILCWLAIRNLIKSGWGTSVIALRDHPYMAVSTGVNRIRVRAALFSLTGIPCGLAGALYVHSQQFFSAGTFGPVLVLLMIGGVLLGGRGTLWGPVFGVVIFSVFSLWLGPFSLYNPLILGLGVMGAALMFRFGIVGTAAQFWGKHGPSKGEATRLLTLDDESDSTPPISAVQRPPTLQVLEVSKHFGGTYALQQVSLEAVAGSIVTVIGANGSGKTTLLNCVSGFVTPDAGEIVLDGHDITKMSPHRRAHLGVARTFQQPRLVEELTVLQNVEMGVFGLDPQTVTGSLFRTPSYRARQAAATERAMLACRTLGLSDRATAAQAGELTLATRRMVEIARALAADASVICLDEPVAGLNHQAQARVARVLRDLAASGRAILLIEHNLPFVLSISDELVLLRDGQLVDRGVAAHAGDIERPLGSYFQTFVAEADREAVEQAIRMADQPS